LLTVLTAPGPLGGAETTVTFRNRRRWVFPAEECLLLPGGNTTAEWLARWIGLETAAMLAAAGHVIRGGMRVSVDECLGQSAVWERRG
jgi:6-pyruvoyltetrahydropterin/6-carboxytetrahydropterin synthase